MRLLNILAFGNILLQTTSAFAQDHYQFPPETQLIDIPGDHFLTWKITNDRVFFRERNAQSAIVWADTLNADQTLNMGDFSMQRFGQTDQYRVFLTGFINGQSVISHATFSPQTHTYGAFRTDTISNFGIGTCSVNDTLLYLFTNDAEQVWSVSAAGDFQPVATNVNWPEPITSTFKCRNNEIIHVWNGSQNLHSRRYDLQMQPLADEDSLTVLGDYTYRQELLRRWQGNDSLFAAFFTTENLPTVMKGRFMAWLSPDLQVIDVYTEEFPGDQPYYQSVTYQAAMTSEYVYFIGELTPNSGDSQWRVYVYDHTFTPVCDFPAQGNFWHNLTVLNDKAYIIDNTNIYVELFLIDGCGISGLQEEEVSVIRVYPNPSNGEITVAFAAGTVNVIELCDLSGKRMQQVPVQTTEESLTLDLSALEAGVYWLRAVGEPGVSVERLVIGD